MDGGDGTQMDLGDGLRQGSARARGCTIGKLDGRWRATRHRLCVLKALCARGHSHQSWCLGVGGRALLLGAACAFVARDVLSTTPYAPAMTSDCTKMTLGAWLPLACLHGVSAMSLQRRVSDEKCSLSACMRLSHSTPPEINARF